MQSLTYYPELLKIVSKQKLSWLVFFVKMTEYLVIFSIWAKGLTKQFFLFMMYIVRLVLIIYFLVNIVGSFTKEITYKLVTIS